MIYLVCYDISTDAIRNKVSKRLVAAAYERIQWSVFVGLQHPKDIPELWATFQQWLSTEPSAKLYVLKIAKNNFRQLENIGKINLDVDYLLGEKNSIFI